MKKLIHDFPQHLGDALHIAQQARLKPAAREIRQVVITGLGGSGIGGTIVSELLSERCKVPILVNKGYDLPSFVNRYTLVLVSTYSGNTEETLSALHRADEAQAEIAIITSGGEALKFAQEKDCNHIVVPGGNPPRSMLAYSFVQLLKLMSHFNLATGELMNEVSHAIQLLEENQGSIRAEGTEIAQFLQGKFPVIYAPDGYEGVAVRFRQQLNENSKMVGWQGVVPEMNHNQLVGWAGGTDQLGVIFFRNETDDPRIQKRIEINQEIIRRNTSHVREMWSKGGNKMEQMLYLIHLGDWASYDLSELNDVDIMEIEVIDYLKSELSKFKG